MKSGFDINRIDGDGYLILPLSMSRLAHGRGQDPEQCYEVFNHFIPKFESFSNDVILLYTYGLYTNTEEPGFETRKKLNQQALNHVTRLRSLIEKKKEYIPGAFHFLPFDYVVLNSPRFHDFYSILKKSAEEDEHFRAVLEKDMSGREYSEANLNFLLEEIVIAHIVRQHMVDFPRTLVRRDIWRLIVYPGAPILSSAYQIQKKILPQEDAINPYALGQYDFENKVFNDYREIVL